MSQKLSAEQVAQFNRDGYLILDLFDKEEMDLLIGYSKNDQALLAKAHGRKDAQGGVSKLSIWDHPGDDLYGLFSRCERLVNTSEQLMDCELYHWHSKMMLKEPKVGGAWEWHQDYGYWYKNACLFPDMISALIAVDGATKENGCLQVIKGSHKLGRIEHGFSGEQVGANMERVNEALKRLPLVYCEVQPGSVIFFHGNLLHRSDQNTSERPRWSLICCYNAKHNDPFKDAGHARYNKLQKVPDASIKEFGRTMKDKDASKLVRSSLA